MSCREEAIVIDDEEYVPKRKAPVTRLQVKKARAAGEPTSDDHAQVRLLSKWPSSEAIDYAYCHPCGARDSIDVELAELADRFECLPQSRDAFSAEQAAALLGECGCALTLAVRARSDLHEIATYVFELHRGHDFLAAHQQEAFTATATAIDTIDTLILARTIAGQHTGRQCAHRTALALKIEDALPLLPSVVADTVVSYADVMREFIDPLFSRDVCAAYNCAVLYLLKQQCRLTSDFEAHVVMRRANADIARRAATAVVRAVMRGASLIGVDATLARKIRATEFTADDFMMRLRNMSYCEHTPALAKSARLELLRCRKDVDEEASRMRALGFDVCAKFGPAFDK